VARLPGIGGLSREIREVLVSPFAYHGEKMVEEPMPEIEGWEAEEPYPAMVGMGESGGELGEIGKMF